MPGQRESQATRREQILEAAYEVALRRGIDGLTVRAVAARARLSSCLTVSSSSTVISRSAMDMPTWIRLTAAARRRIPPGFECAWPFRAGVPRPLPP